MKDPDIINLLKDYCILIIIITVMINTNITNNTLTYQFVKFINNHLPLLRTIQSYNYTIFYYLNTVEHSHYILQVSSVAITASLVCLIDINFVLISV